MGPASGLLKVSFQQVVLLCMIGRVYESYYNLPTSTPGLGVPRLDQASPPPCRREAIRQGKWAARRDGDPSTDRYRWEPSDLPRNTPARPRSGTGHGHHSTDRYRWEPSESGGACRFRSAFDVTLFCEVMANKVVAFLGDLLTWEMYVPWPAVSHRPRAEHRHVVPG